MSGYEPRWDLDLPLGQQAEQWVADILAGVHTATVTAEVKYDTRAAGTGNVYVEYECLRADGWHPSGIAKTESDLWVAVIAKGQMALVCNREWIADLARTYYSKDFGAWRRDMSKGSHPTRGVLIPVADLLAAATPEDRRSAA